MRGGFAVSVTALASGLHGVAQHDLRFVECTRRGSGSSRWSPRVWTAWADQPWLAAWTVVATRLARSTSSQVHACWRVFNGGVRWTGAGTRGRRYRAARYELVHRDPAVAR